MPCGGPKAVPEGKGHVILVIQGIADMTVLFEMLREFKDMNSHVDEMKQVM